MKIDAQYLLSKALGLRLVFGFLAIAVVGFAIAFLGSNNAALWQGYWLAFIFYTAISLGGLYFVLMQHLTRSGWSVVVRRLSEHFMRNIWIMLLFLLPLIFGMHDLFSWSDTAHAAHDPILQAKAPYLNVPFFWIRSIGYFLIWGGIAAYFFALSRKQDSTGNPELTANLQAKAGIALVVYGLTQTFASFDWLMSLSPHWFSTLFGVYFFAGTAVVFLAALSVTLLILRSRGILAKVVTVEHYHDIGKLLYGYMMFWGYLAFSQLMVIWISNIPEEGAWYIVRGSYGSPWQWVTILLAVGYFVIPFFLFMSRHAKRNLVVHFAIALWLMAMPLVDYFWIIQPNFTPTSLGLSWAHLGMFLGVGGVYFAALCWQMSAHPLVPVQDPRLSESLHFENF